MKLYTKNSLAKFESIETFKVYFHFTGRKNGWLAICNRHLIFGIQLTVRYFFINLSRQSSGCSYITKGEIHNLRPDAFDGVLLGLEKENVDSGSEHASQQTERSY